MKILAIHNYYQIRSGEDLAFDATVEGLEKEGHSVVRLTQDNRALHSKGAGIRLALGTVFSLKEFVRAWKEISRSKPSVALVQNVFPLLSPSVYLALKMRRVPVVQRIFNYRLVCPNGILYTRGAICERCKSGRYWNAVRFACYRKSRAASAALAGSLWIWRTLGLWRWGVRFYLTPDRFLGEKILPAIGDEGKIRIVFNPVPAGSRSLEQQTKRGRDILFVGRWVREKGIFTLVKIARELPEYRFLIVGTGEDETEARKLASELALENVEWRGPVYGAELEQLLRVCGALVLPSEWYDNMPLILTQALLAGIPIVASRINGIPEFVIDGQTGRLAEAGNALDFAEKIRGVFSEPETSMALARCGQTKAHEWFLSDGFSQGLAQVLREASQTT